MADWCLQGKTGLVYFLNNFKCMYTTIWQHLVILLVTRLSNVTGNYYCKWGWLVVWPNIKLEHRVRLYPPPGLPLEVQEVQYLSHCFSSRPYFQSIKATASRHPSELYSNCSNLNLHSNYSFVRVDYRGHWAPPSSSKLDSFSCTLLGTVATGATENNKCPQVLKVPHAQGDSWFCDEELGMLALTVYHQLYICAHKLRMRMEGCFPR